ncbi:hypothetical protein ACWFRB_09330 [Rhodococcus sp. NPDC055112]
MTEIHDGEPMLHGRDYDFLESLPGRDDTAFQRYASMVLGGHLLGPARWVVVYYALWNLWQRRHTLWPNPFLEPLEDRVDHLVIRRADGVRLYDENWNEVDELVLLVEPARGFRGLARLGEKVPSWTVSVGLEPEPVIPQSQALPRPSHTPPMWANNPTQQRRTRKTRNHRRVK